jgi:gamma-glutamyl phosphate reductase
VKGKKNDYSMTFYDGEEKRLFLEFVHSTDTAIAWVNGRGIKWTHAMIYERRTRKKLDRIINSER